MKIDDITQASLLYDFYGQLLTKRKREVMELYYEENLSLTEIADEFGISKQAVSDALRNAVKSLNEYESKLGLVEKLQNTNDAIARIDGIIDSIIGGKLSSEDTITSLRTVKDIIDKLED
ncbi:MAG: helix-turn-helix domain-containing protein [Eubacterium sp.]|nr:helix-turn-helix domain-containing protein [Candidatus Colimonas fimequi]